METDNLIRNAVGMGCCTCFVVVLSVDSFVPKKNGDILDISLQEDQQPSNLRKKPFFAFCFRLTMFK